MGVTEDPLHCHSLLLGGPFWLEQMYSLLGLLLPAASLGITLMLMGNL